MRLDSVDIIIIDEIGMHNLLCRVAQERGHISFKLSCCTHTTFEGVSWV